MIKKVSFFTTLSENHSKGLLRKIYDVLELKRYKKDEIVCKYGDIGDAFYIILDGQVGVHVPTKFEHQLDTYLQLF